MGGSKMKRVLMVCLVAAMVFALFAVPATAADDNAPGLYWTTTHNQSLVTKGNSTEVAVEGDVFKVTFTGTSDPQFNIAAPEGSTISATDYKYLCMMIKKAGPNNGDLYFETKTSGGYAPETNATYAYTDSADWQKVIVTTLATHAKWKDEIKQIRIDPFGEASADAAYEVKYIALFKTEDAAKAFNGDFSAYDSKPEPVAERVYLWDTSANHDAFPVSGSATDIKTVGGTFTAESGKRVIKFYVDSIPSGGPSQTTTFTLKIYKWDTDYATSVKAAPVYTSEKKADLPDNAADVEFVLGENGLTAGSYLWVMEIESAYAPWFVASPSQTAETTCFSNGQALEGKYFKVSIVTQEGAPDSGDSVTVFLFVLVALAAMVIVKKKSFAY